MIPSAHNNFDWLSVTVVWPQVQSLTSLLTTPNSDSLSFACILVASNSPRHAESAIEIPHDTERGLAFTGSWNISHSKQGKIKTARVKFNLDNNN